MKSDDNIDIDANNADGNNNKTFFTNIMQTACNCHYIFLYTNANTNTNTVT